MKDNDKYNYLSTGDNEYPTPQWLFDKINNIYNFDMDLCATKENTKCEKYYTKEQDSLKQIWNDKINWCNPPYSKDLQPLFIKKAYESHLKYNNVFVFLIPLRPDVQVWHDCIWGKTDIYIFKGRPKFYADKSPTYPSATVVFNNNKEKHIYTVDKNFDNIKLIY